MSEHIRTLEHHLERLRYAKCGHTNFDMWEHFGASVSSDEERAKMYAERDECNRIYDESKAAIEALVGRLRTEEPHVVEAWVDAHDRLLMWLEEVFTKNEDTTNAFMAEQDRVEWAKVLRGELAVVNERVYYGEQAMEPYRELFGFELKP